MTRLHKALSARMDKAVYDYHMFSDNDSVLVAVSGGADSMVLVNLLVSAIGHYGKGIKLYALYIDLGFGGEVEKRCRSMGSFFQHLSVDYKIITTDFGPYAHSEKNRENPCFLCSRMKRKKIFETAEELDCNVIAFGHHKDDLVETLLLNMMIGREISTMVPNLMVFQGKYRLVRPLIYIEEELIKKYCLEKDMILVDQKCPTDGRSKRQFIKELLSALEEHIPGARENIFASMKRVKIDYLL